ncbi:MAG: hypothetical protein FJ184_12245 [Gammaproteobacteria bacterium]|nr:hypothetical protein [Gammaproteobacteria bacterium]
MINYVRHLVVLLMLGVVSSCASVPITSMIQLAAMGRSGLEQVDPTEIRVRVSVSPGFEIDVVRTTLGFSIARSEGPSRNEKLTLELIERTTMERSLGFMRGSVSVPTYVLRLTPADVQKFLEIRRSALAKDSRAKRTFSISAPFSKTPKNPQAVTFWTDLKFSSDGSWVVLLDGAELVFKTAP